MIIIGFDHRNNSKVFAQTAAKVFQSYGHKVRIFPSIVPTPFVPSAIQYFKGLETDVNVKVGMGVMITASHNPKGDNGYKVYGENGAQIQDETAKKISEFIANEKINFLRLKLNKINDELLLVNDEDLMDKVKNWYIKQLREWLEIFPKPTEESIDKFRFVYTGLHGVGAIYLDEIFKSVYPDLDIKKMYVHVEDQRFPDSEFSTVEFPNPEEGKSTLRMAIERAEAVGIETIFANDPDADRFCVAQKSKSKSNEGDWKIFNGNEIAVLLADFIGSKFRENEKIAILGSCVSSRFLKLFCDKRNWKYEATLTGFKNLGNRGIELKEKEGFKVILAYEEAIGFQVGDWNFDKDGLTTLMTFYSVLLNISDDNGGDGGGGDNGSDDNSGGDSSGDNISSSHSTDNITGNSTDNITGNNTDNIIDNSTDTSNNSISISLNEKLNQIYKREECWPIQCNGYYFCKPASRIKTLLNKAIESLFDNKNNLWSSINKRARDIEMISPNSSTSCSGAITLEFGMEGLGRAWLMLRSSGTEPKLKFYSELLVLGKEQICGIEGVEEKLKGAVEEIINELLEPEKNGLIKKK